MIKTAIIIYTNKNSKTTDFFKKNDQVLSSAKNIDDTVNNFEFENWLGFYNYKMYLLKNIDFHLKKLLPT